MNHLVMVEIEFVEGVSHAHYLVKLMIVLLVLTPRLRKKMLYSLQSPQEIEDLFIGLHHFLSEYS